MSPCLFMENKMRDHPQTMAMQQLQGSGAEQMSELVERLRDLHKQATVERSHYYVGKCALDAADLIEALEAQLADNSERYGNEIAARIAALEAALTEARQLVTEANNSLYGSQSYFHSLNGGPFNKHHLAAGIENLKADANRDYRRIEALEGALREIVKMCDVRIHRLSLFDEIQQHARAALEQDK